MKVFQKLVGRWIESIRIGSIVSWDEEQCEDVAELTLDNGEVVLLCAYDVNNERFYSTFGEARRPEEQNEEEHGDPDWWEKWNCPLTPLEEALKDER